MDSNTRLGVELFAVALGLGIAAEGLMHGSAWGLGAALWVLLLATASAVLLRRWQPSRWATMQWWVLPLPVLAILFVWRDAPLLRVLDALAVGGVLAVAVQQAQRSQADAHESPGLVVSGLRALFGLPRFAAQEVEWASVPDRKALSEAKAVGRGAALAVPVVGVFGLLLVSADATFERLVMQAFDVNAAAWPGQLAFGGAAALVCAAFLRGALLRVWPEGTEAVPRHHLGATEARTLLLVVNGLLGLFVAIQLPYLFGGADAIERLGGMPVAPYARRGFFELVAVAALAVPLLLTIERRLRTSRPGHLRHVRALAAVQGALLAMLLASAAQRMWLYQATFGLTTLRVVVGAALVWLLLAFGWFGWTALRGRAERFVPGAAVAGLLVLIGLHAINPEALVVRTNVARAAEGQRTLDTCTLARLSADAVPSLVREAGRVGRTRQVQARSPCPSGLRGVLDAHAERVASADWRGWNRGRARARAVLKGSPAVTRP